MQEALPNSQQMIVWYFNLFYLVSWINLNMQEIVFNSKDIKKNPY